MDRRNYALLNLNETGMMLKVNGATLVVLFILARGASFGDGGFYFRMDDAVRADVMKEVAISRPYLNTIVSVLLKCGFIRKRMAGSYFINPHILFKGSGGNNGVAIKSWDGIGGDKKI